jgi:hypothetical protein
MILDTNRLSALTPEETRVYETMIQNAQVDAAPRQKIIIDTYIKTEAPKLVKVAASKGGILPLEDAERTVHARCQGGQNRDLYRDDIIELDRFGIMTVGEILKNFSKFDQATARDPQEPEQGKGKGKLYSNKKEQKPCLHSFCHGGIEYFLHNVPVGAEIRKAPPAAIEDTLQWINDTDDLPVIVNEWLDHITGMSAPDIEAVKGAVQKKTGVKISILNKCLKEKDAEEAKKKAKAREKETSKKRAKMGIREIGYDPTHTGMCCHEASRALRDHPEKKIYRHGGNIVKIANRQPVEIRMVQRAHDQGGKYPPMPTIAQLTKESLCHELEKVAVCQTMDEEGNGKDMPWPKNILTGIPALTEPHEKPLVGIVEHPYIDDNFKPVLSQGYDDATGLYKVFDVVPNIKSFKNAGDAMVYIVDELLQDFPFSSELDQMAAASCLLTGMQRKLIFGGCPGYLFTAPVQSSGKTALCQAIIHSLHGRPAAASSFADDDNEMAKHLLGILQEGHSAILFDNLPEGSVVESNELAKAITADTYSNRWLGKNQTATVPSSVLWLMTGNNISVCGDFNTRFLKIELDTKEANPDQRRYKREDIGQWCDDHRGKILGACMKIIMDGAGYSNPDLKPTRFPSWDKFVRLPIYKTTKIDIAEIFQKNKLSDPKIEGQNNFFEAWFNAFGSSATTAKQVLAHCQRVTPEEKFSGIGEDNEMAEVMRDIFTGGSLPSTRALGKWLGCMKNRFFGEYKLIHAGTGTSRVQAKRALWVVGKNQ